MSAITLERGWIRHFVPPPLAIWGGEVPRPANLHLPDPFQGQQDHHFRDRRIMQGLLEWCTTVGFAKLQRALEDAHPVPGDGQTIVVDSRSYRIEAGLTEDWEFRISAWRKLDLH